MKNLNKKLLNAMSWSYFLDFISRILNPLFTIIIARILLPEYFGVFGMSMVVISFLVLLEDMISGFVVIKEKEISDSVLNIIFCNNILFGLCLFSFVFFCASFIAVYFQEPRVENILKVMSIIFLINSFTLIQRNLLKKNLDFKKIFFIDSFIIVISGIITIILALMGMKELSLAIGFLSGPLILIFFIGNFVKWRPKFKYDFGVAKKLFALSALIMLELIFSWAIFSVDDFFVGRFQGASVLGVYIMGFNIAMLPSLFIIGPIKKVMYPFFCKINYEHDSIKRYYLKYLSLVPFCIFPLCIFIFFATPNIVPVILGKNWLGSIVVIQLIIISGMFAPLAMMNFEVFRAIGRIDVTIKFLLVRVALSLPAYYLAAQQGIIQICIAHLVLTGIFAPTNLIICIKLLKVSFRDVFEALKPSFLINLLLIFVFFGLKLLITAMSNVSNILALFLYLSGGVISFVLFLNKLENKKIISDFRILYKNH